MAFDRTREAKLATIARKAIRANKAESRTAHLKAERAAPRKVDILRNGR